MNSLCICEVQWKTTGSRMKTVIWVWTAREEFVPIESISWIIRVSSDGEQVGTLFSLVVSAAVSCHWNPVIHGDPGCCAASFCCSAAGGPAKVVCVFTIGVIKHFTQVFYFLFTAGRKRKKLLLVVRCCIEQQREKVFLCNIIPKRATLKCTMWSICKQSKNHVLEVHVLVII